MNNKDFEIFSIEQTKGDISSYFSLETSIFLQLRGSSKVSIGSEKKDIKREDLFIVNRNEKISITNMSEEQGILVGISISNSYFFSVYEDFSTVRFDHYPDKDFSSEVLGELKSEIAKLILAYSSHSKTKKLTMLMSLNKLVVILLSNFKRESDLMAYKNKMDKKIVNVLKYIDENYNQELTLEKVAKDHFISSPSLSKLFKAETNQYFSDYLNRVRVDKSLEDLLYTGESIENIALKHGFQSDKTYRSHFRRLLSTTPSKYRQAKAQKLGRQQTISKNIDILSAKDKDIFNSLYSYILIPNENHSKPIIAERHNKLIIDSKIDREQIKSTKIIHIGVLSELLDMDIKEEFQMAQQAIGLDYIGIYEIYESYPHSYVNQYSKELGMYPIYGKFDKIVKMLIENNIGIYYQLNLGELILGRDQSYIQLINFLGHIKNMYGEDFFKKIRINLIFDSHNLSREIDIFKTIKTRLRTISPFLEFGASLPLSYPDYSFRSEDIEKTYLDEVLREMTFVSFSSEVNKVYDFNKDIIMDMDLFNEFVYKEARFFKSLLTKWDLDLNLVLTEWNTLTSIKQDINGIFFRAAIILQEILKLDLIVESYGFWLNAGLYNKYKLDKTNKYNGLELFHNYNGKKPIYHVLTIAARLNGKVKFLGREVMLLQNNDNYQLLIWNPNYFNPVLSKEKTFLDSQSILYNIEIPYIRDNFYQIKRIDFNRASGALFYVYKDFNSQFPIDLECHDYISQLSTPKISVFDKAVEDGFNFSCILDTNAITLLELKAMKKSI